MKNGKSGGNSAGFLRNSAGIVHTGPADMGSLRQRIDLAGVYVPGSPPGMVEDMGYPAL